ncbi:MAG: Uncharacterized protein AWU57_581 [Marinobacter sp. T13-3]|nr:MAG: Uncharacterized protein AWU57_581 [Marinobacter sp. T13-3]
MFDFNNTLQAQIRNTEKTLADAAQSQDGPNDQKAWARYDLAKRRLDKLATENHLRMSVAQTFLNASDDEARQEGINNARMTFEGGLGRTDPNAPSMDAYCEYWELAAQTARDYMDENNLAIPPLSTHAQSSRLGQKVVGHMIYDWQGELARITTDDTDAEMAEAEGGTVTMNATAADVMEELPPRLASEVMDGSTWDNMSAALQNLAQAVEAEAEYLQDRGIVPVIPPTQLDTPVELVDKRMDALQRIYDPLHDGSTWVELQELLFAGHQHRPINLTRLRPDNYGPSFRKDLLNRDTDELMQESLAVDERKQLKAAERATFGGFSPNTFRSDIIDDIRLDELDYALEQKGANDNSDAAARERDLLVESITEAAQTAGVVEPGTELIGPQLLMAVNDMAMAARETVTRNEVKAAANNESGSELSGLAKAGLAHEAFGNPIPQEAYKLIDATLEAVQDQRQAPTFDAVRDNLMRDMAPEQEGDVRELWIRENIEKFQNADDLKFLLDRLQSTRKSMTTTSKENTNMPRANVDRCNDTVKEVLSDLKHNGYTITSVFDSEEYMAKADLDKANEAHDLASVTAWASAADMGSISLQDKEGETFRLHLAYDNLPEEVIADMSASTDEALTRGEKIVENCLDDLYADQGATPGMG